MKSKITARIRFPMSNLSSEKAKTLGYAAAVFVVAGMLYFLTAARDIVVGDAPELITAAATLGVPHAPGYPLFTMLGHLFSLIPLGSIPFRVNLLSVICDALTVGVIYFTALKLTESRVAAAVAALVLAVNPTFWTWSLAVEVFPLNNLIAALLIFFLVTWHEQSERCRFLVTAFFLAGLGLTNHQTIVLLAPAFYFVLWQRPEFLERQFRLLAICIAAFLLGLLPYMYVPWASAHHPPYNWGNVSSARDLLALILRKGYGSGRLVATAGYAGGSPAARIAALCVSFGPLTGILILLGAVRAYQRQRWYFWFNAIGFVCAGPFFVWVTNLNLTTAPSALFVLQRFFLLSHVLLGPLVAFGVLWIAESLADVVPARPGVWPVRFVAAACLLAAGAVGLTNYRRIDQSHNFIARHFGEDVFAAADPGSILLVTGDGIAFPLLYLQTVEKLGTHATLVIIPLLRTGWYVNQLRQAHPDLHIPFDRYDVRTNNLKMFAEANRGRTICFTSPIEHDDHSLDADYWPYQQGLLIILEPKGKNIPLKEMIEKNERLFRRYHPPPPEAVRADSFENDILTSYAWPAFRIGSDCARVGLEKPARAWYERALAINPRLSQARDALEHLGSNSQD